MLLSILIIWATSWQNQQNDCAPSEDSDQPGHPPSVIRVFAVRMKKAWVLSYPLSAQRRLWSDWMDAQADMSLRWAHSHFVAFVMRRPNYVSNESCFLHSTFYVGGYISHQSAKRSEVKLNTVFPITGLARWPFLQSCNYSSFYQ